MSGSVSRGALIGDLGLSAAALQADEITPDQQTQLFWTSSGLGLLMAGLVAGSAPLIALLYDEPRLTGVVLVTSVCFLLAGLTTLAALCALAPVRRDVTTLLALASSLRPSGWGRSRSRA